MIFSHIQSVGVPDVPPCIQVHRHSMPVARHAAPREIPRPSQGRRVRNEHAWVGGCLLALARAPSIGAKRGFLTWLRSLIHLGVIVRAQVDERCQVRNPHLAPIAKWHSSWRSWRSPSGMAPIAKWQRCQVRNPHLAPIAHPLGRARSQGPPRATIGQHSCVGIANNPRISVPWPLRMKGCVLGLVKIHKKPLIPSPVVELVE